MHKICVIGSNHGAHQVRVYHRICRSLAQAGHQVHLVAQDDGQGGFAEGIAFSSVGEHRPIIPLRPWARFKRVRQAFSKAKRSDADLFQFHSPEFISHGLLLRRQSGRPVVFDCMEDFESYIGQRPGIPWWLRPLLLRFTRTQLRRAGETLDAIVTADPGTEEYFRPWARRVLTLYNYPLLEQFPDTPEQAQPAYDLVYHGGLARSFLEMMLQVDDALQVRRRSVTWYLFGNMPERDWFAGEVRKRQAESRFHIGERVAHDQVMSRVRQARIGIIPLPDLPKYQHNIPQKLFEYMALRMPVVMSDLPPSRPFVGDGACAILVKPDEPFGYADAILGLLEDPALRQRMGAEGRMRVESVYNWERESGKLLALHDELLGRQR